MSQTEAQPCPTAGKIRYPTRRSAEHALEFINRRHRRGALMAYRCTYCGDWHLGNRRGQPRS